MKSIGVSVPVFFRNFHIESSGELDKLSNREKTMISDDLVNFLQRYRAKFGEAHLHINLKQHKEKFREQPLMYSKLKLSTDKGNFNSSADGWGSEQSVHNALAKLELQIDKKFAKHQTNASIRKAPAREVFT